MTELETHLLTALKNLGQQFNEQQRISEQGQNALSKMFERISQENKVLQKQVNVLSEQVEKLAKLYSKN